VIQQPDLDAVHDRYPPVDARVAEILENIRRDCRELRLGRRLDAQRPLGVSVEEVDLRTLATIR
jgi:hypothetical protein